MEFKLVMQFRKDMDEMRVVSRQMNDLDKYHAFRTRKSRPAELLILQVFKRTEYYSFNLHPH